MNRLQPLVGIAFFVGLLGVALAHSHDDGERVRVISSRDIQEKIDGKKSKATIVEVTFGPGQSEQSHRHPGPAFVYVLEGEYELGIDDEPTEVFKAGDTFYEPTGCLHRVSRNLSSSGPTRLIAVVLHPHDHNIDEIAVPVEAHEQDHHVRNGNGK